MLTAGDASKGSAGYVAIEQVTGTLAGRSGSFALQHSGTMENGKQQLSVKVVPGSTTGQLEGLTGTMTIKIESGKHFYDFEYTLPGSDGLAYTDNFNSAFTVPSSNSLFSSKPNFLQIASI